jgi:large-conductance mechanosensitive channel
MPSDSLATEQPKSLNYYFTDFTDFLTQYNIVGLGIGTLVAVSAYNVGANFTEAIVMPLTKALLSSFQKDSTFDLMAVMQVKSQDLLKALLTFVVTMFIIYFLIKMFNIRMTRWVQWVKVVEDDKGWK